MRYASLVVVVLALFARPVSSSVAYAKGPPVATRADTIRMLTTLLQKNGGGKAASQVAVAVYEHSKAMQLPPKLVIAVISAENPDLDRHARSSAGAIGIMQVLGSWRGKFKCGSDLTDIDQNVCYGTHVLAMHLADAHGKLRPGLLAYSGCVATPGCKQYAEVVINRFQTYEEH